SGADVFTQYENVCDGGFIEHAMGKDWSVEEWGGWDMLMGWYRALKTNLAGSRTILFDVYLPSTTDYKNLRYAFATCLMDDGYFCASTDYNQIPWFDEYDLAGTGSTHWLGTAIDGPQTVACQLGVYRH